MYPYICNEPLKEVALFNIVNPDTYNDDINVVLYVVSVNIAQFKVAGNRNDPSVDVQQIFL